MNRAMNRGSLHRKARRWASWPVLACLACVACGCAVGPDFQPPAAPSATRYTEQPLPGVANEDGVRAQSQADGPDDAQTRRTGSADAVAHVPAMTDGTPVQPQVIVEGADLRADWWKVFRSPALDALIEAALAASPDLAAADAAVRVADENVLAQRGAFFPSVQAQFSPSRQTVAGDLTSPLTSGSTSYTLHTASLAIGYVPDVFGRNRRAVESLRASADMQRFQLDAARLTLVSNLVAAVIQQASLREQAARTRELAAASRRQLEMLRRQQRAGQIGSPDVIFQETVVAQTEALLPALDKQALQQADLIALLTGRTAAEALPHDIALDALLLPAELPLALPSRLVERRPDIRAAREQWHAATAQIGVATADRLPDLSLTASLGSSAERLSQLFASGTGFWGLGANLLAPVFDGGTLQHRQRAAEAAAQQAAAQYRSTVLVAFQNVADTLAAIDADARTLERQAAAEQAARRSLAVAQRLAATGSTGSLPVLVAQQSALQAAVASVQARAARLTDSVALFQALGGSGWLAEPPSTPTSEAAAGR
jgi:NodT family efflux transporter outer membrane factor (OMF) lipoprotein